MKIAWLVLALALVTSSGCSPTPLVDGPGDEELLDLSGTWQLLQENERTYSPDTAVILRFMPEGIVQITDNNTPQVEGQFQLDPTSSPPQLTIQLGNLKEFHIARLRSDGLLELAQGDSTFPRGFQQDGVRRRLYRPISAAPGTQPLAAGATLEQRLQGTWTGSTETPNRLSAWVVDYQQGGLGRMLEVTIDRDSRTYQRLDLEFHWSLENELLVEKHNPQESMVEMRYELVNLTSELLECRLSENPGAEVTRHQRAADFETAVALLPARPAGFQLIRSR